MKRKIAILLSVIMLFGMVTQAAGTSFTDIEGLPCEKAVQTLMALDIVEGKEEGKYKPEDALTRAEMVTIILRAMNVTATAKGEKFADVSDKHWAYNHIYTAYQLKLIEGVSETEFAPDAAVTYEQAAKMIVCMLGYGVHADSMGGYPAGYLSKAAQLGVTKGLSGNDMNRGIMAIMMYNALAIEISQPMGYGGDASYTYETVEGRTFLSYYKKIDVLNSCIVATAMTQFKTASLAENSVMLENGMVLDKGETQTDEIIGMNAEIYVAEDDAGDAYIKAIIPKKSAKTIEIYADKVSNTTTSSLFEYEDENKKTEKVAIQNAVLCYNGRPALKTSAKLMPNIGTVRLIFDGNECTHILVESYTDYIVNSTDKEENKLYFMEAVNGVSDITIEDSELVKFTDAEGNVISVADCMKWDVISVAESDDKSVKKLIASTEKITGTVTEISRDKVTIEGNVYTISPALLASSQLKKPAVGQSAAYYLDFTGCIAALDTAYEDEHQYAWLVNAALTEGLGAKPQFKLFTGEGEMIVLNCPERVKFNGISVKRSDLLKVGSPLLELGSEDVKPQLLRYETNEEKTLLTSIETATNMTLEDNGSNGGYTDADRFGNEEFNVSYYLDSKGRLAPIDNYGNPIIQGGQEVTYVPSRVLYIGGTVCSFVSRLLPREKTKIFVIPAEGSDDEDYRIKDYTTLSHGDTGELYSNLSFYDADEDMIVGAMVWDRSSEGGTIGGDYPDFNNVNNALVTDIYQGITEKGEISIQVKVINDAGKEVVLSQEQDFKCLYKMANADFDNDPDWYTTADGVRGMVSYGAERCEMFINLNDLDAGDVIQYQADANGKATLISVIYRTNYNELPMEYAGNAGRITPTNQYGYYMGGTYYGASTVQSSSELGISAIANLVGKDGRPTGETAIRAISLTTKILMWDKKNSIMKTIMANEIAKGDRVLSIWKTNRPLMTIIYR